MANRFYVSSELNGGDIVLQGAEAHHLATVHRLGIGDTVSLFNGNGNEYAGTIIEASRRRAVVRITGQEAPPREWPYSVQVAAPLPKAERAQFLVEKLTEIGVSRYIPLETKRTVVQPGRGKIQKLHRYVVEASKQCGRNVLMEIADPMDWLAFCCCAGLPLARFLAHPSGGEMRQVSRSGVALAIGPEGGFTDEELTLARSNNWHIVGLGPRILRIETAALLLAIRALYPV
jgi:16S rRNA (uracil1498-N3)-methyltransferase